ncbi:hypothetical protein [Haladaptatus sp. NG-SE-30]
MRYTHYDGTHGPRDEPTDYESSPSGGWELVHHIMLGGRTR